MWSCMSCTMFWYDYCWFWVPANSNYPQCKLALSPLFLQDVQDMHITYHFQSEWPQSPRNRATWTKPTIPRSNFFCARFNKQPNKRYHFPKKGIKITLAHFFCNKGGLRYVYDFETWETCWVICLWLWDHRWPMPVDIEHCCGCPWRHIFADGRS